MKEFKLMKMNKMIIKNKKLKNKILQKELKVLNSQKIQKNLMMNKLKNMKNN